MSIDRDLNAQHLAQLALSKKLVQFGAKSIPYDGERDKKGQIFKKVSKTILYYQWIINH